MKKGMLFISVVAACLMTSCSLSKKAASLTGAWNIVAINGQAVDTTKVDQAPVIAFDRVDNRIYGNASCNRFFGNLKLDSIKSEISFGEAGATRMLCPNMEIEDAILATLDKISRYKSLSESEVELCDADGQTLLLIRKQ